MTCHHPDCCCKKHHSVTDPSYYRARMVGFLLSNHIDPNRVSDDSEVDVDYDAKTVTVNEIAYRDGEPWFIGDYPVRVRRTYRLRHDFR